MATQDMVNYHTEILSSILTKPINDDDVDSDPLADVEFFKLYGDMMQRERTDVFKTFRQAKSGVLLCTVSLQYFTFSKVVRNAPKRPQRFRDAHRLNIFFAWHRLGAINFEVFLFSRNISCVVRCSRHRVN